MNDGRPPERWILALDVRDDGTPPAVTMKRLLKHIWRQWGIRCRGFSEDQEKYRLMIENERLHKIIDELTTEKKTEQPC